MIAKFDHRRSPEHPVLVNDELPVLQGIDVALNQQQVRATLDRQETTTRDVNAVGILEMLNCCSCRRLELNTRMSGGLRPFKRETVQTWITDCPSSVTLGLTMISSSMPSLSMIRFKA